MSGNSPQRFSRALPLAGLMRACLAAAPLAGCGVDYASNDPALLGDYHKQHPIVLAQAPATLDVYPVGQGLDAQSVANIRNFAERYREFGSGRITILAPNDSSGRDSRVVDQIRRTLASTGLRGYVGVGAYRVADPTRASPVRLIYQGLKAVLPEACGRWPSDLASGASIETWKNETYPNFGCATQSMLAAQVADPRDLVQARALDAPDVTMRLRAIGDVRDGKDPGTDWKTKITTIGQVGSGD
jgi:pilus assembly protein CpaD